MSKVFKKVLCVRDKCTLTTYVVATLKSGDMKGINRKQVQEHTKLDSFFYIICLGCQGSIKSPYENSRRKKRHKTILLMQMIK